ncbi:hypothetical protein FHR70_000706 [Microvirga lupini]|uniref:Uncharacterized protein n=1 Tax=Microvirga lupini TaxID=420324 RepID=A0A7W4VI69_9HYPH|nr:hypothetical protein [Microvirga lupini]MBB3017666.1 hypothetical protein [Microvirga lupini]
MSAKPVKAFIIETDDPEESTIQFATTNVAARRQGADEIGTDFEAVSCKRLPWADQYVDSGIPALAYIENDWHVSCANCGAMVHKESGSTDDDGNYEPHEPVYRGEHVFCSPGCETSHDSKVAEQNAKFAAFESRVRELRPDLQYKSFRGAYPYITMTGEFMFDGAKYGGSVRDEGDGALLWFVANGDKAAWDQYEADQAKSGAQ